MRQQALLAFFEYFNVSVCGNLPEHAEICQSWRKLNDTKPHSQLMKDIDYQQVCHISYYGNWNQDVGTLNKFS